MEGSSKSTHNLCFEQKYEKYQSFSSENFQFLGVKFYIYLNRHIFVMNIHEDAKIQLHRYAGCSAFVNFT